MSMSGTSLGDAIGDAIIASMAKTPTSEDQADLKALMRTVFGTEVVNEVRKADVSPGTFTDSLSVIITGLGGPLA